MRRVLVLVFSMVVALVVAYFALRLSFSKPRGPRPMFHEQALRDWGPTWDFMPQRDAFGLWVFTDPALNLIVAVVTDKTVNACGADYGVRSSHLLHGTPYELAVQAEKDRLILVSAKGKRDEFVIDGGVARAVRKAEWADDLLQVITSKYRGPNSDELSRVAEAIRNQRAADEPP